MKSLRFLLAAGFVSTAVWLTALAASTNTNTNSEVRNAQSVTPAQAAPSNAPAPESLLGAPASTPANPAPDLITPSAATTPIFVAAVEQTGANIAQVDLFNVSLGATSGSADSIAPASPATVPVTNSTNEGKPDINNPLGTAFDTSGDLLIGNSNDGGSNHGNLACVPASAILTGANAATTVSGTVTAPQTVAYDSRDGSVALADGPVSAPLQLSQFLPTPNYTAAPGSGPGTRNLVAPGLGNNWVVNLPNLPAGTYASALTDGIEVDTAHNGNTAHTSKIAIYSASGVETDINNPTSPTAFAIDDPYSIAFDSTNNQLVIANFSTWHKNLSFYAVNPVSQVKVINTNRRNVFVATSPDGHVAVIENSSTGSGYQLIQVYDNTAARNPVGGPIPFNSTNDANTCQNYIYGNINSSINAITWLSNTKLLASVTATGNSGNLPSNGLYTFDITSLAVPAGFNDETCAAYAAAPKQTGFYHMAKAPVVLASKPLGTFAEATGGSNCGGNTPCYTSINTAIANTAPGGVVNVFGGTFNESVNLNASVIVNLLGNTTVNDFTISAGTWNGGGGLCAQAGGATLTLTTGNFTNNGGLFNPGLGTVIFKGSAGQSIGGTNQTTFGNLTINNASGVSLALSTTVNATLTLTSGALSVGSNTLTLNGPATATSGSITSSATGTVNYNQASNGQTVAPGSYGNLTFSNFTKTLPSSGTVSIAGTFTTGATGGHTVTGSTVAFNGASAQTLPSTFPTYNNLTINNGSGVTLSGSITVNGALTLTSGNITTGANVLSIGASGTRSRTSGYILGNEKKTYSANGSFTYDVGTANGYSPVDATITAGTGDLTAVAVQGNEASDVSARSLQRYWTLTKGGAGVTANLVFHYLDPTDIMGTESNYQPLQVTGGARTYYVNNCPNTCDNPGANTFSIAGVTTFSDFTAGEARADLQTTSLTDSPDPVIVGNNITYTINVINNGLDNSQNVTVTDAVPANTTFVSASFPAGWSRSDAVITGGTGSIIFTKASVASAESAALQMVVNVNSSTPGGSSISDAAIITSPITTDPTLGNESGNASTLVYTPPVITSGNNATFVVGTTSSFAVTTTGFPAASIARGGVALPAGVTFTSNGDGTGTLSGKPAAGSGGTYAISFTASNAAGTTAAQSFTLTVDEAPTITSGNAATFVVGTSGSFTLTKTGYPVPSLAESGALPSGVTFNTATGVLSGKPAAGTGGSYPISFTASNGIGTDATQSFTLTVNEAPAITSANATTFVVGSAGTFSVTTAGFPVPTVTETGTLPSGVTFDSATKKLAGTAGAGTGGTYPISFKASNGIGTDATQSFTLTVNQAPAITSANAATFTVGSAGTFTVTATGFPTPTFSETGALPNGISLGAVSGVLAGTPGPDTQGTYNITMMASNGVGSAASQPFTLTVNAIPCTAAASGLIMWLPANGNANDLIGSNNAVLQSGATYATGEVGQAFNLVNAPNASSGQYVNVATPVGLPVGNAARTVELWFNSATTLTSSPNAALLQYGTATSEKSFGLVFTATNPGKLYFNGSGDDLAGTTTILPGTWYHAAVTYDGATVKLYLNGQLESSKATALLNTVLDATNGLTIGLRPATSVFNGKIDEVQIFNRALTQAEIQATYYAGAQGTCAPALNLTSAASRRLHGATAFDVALPLTGTAGIEPRTSSPAGSHTVVFTFSHSVTSGSASVTTGTGTAGAATFSGATMSVPLTNVANAQQITLTLNGVTDALSQVLPATTVNMAVLAGDVNGDKVVNAADATVARNQSGLAVDATTFRADVNVDGSIDAADATIVRNNSGTGVSAAEEARTAPATRVPRE